MSNEAKKTFGEHFPEVVFLKVWKAVQEECHRIASEKGFHDEDVGTAVRLALIHSEVSEALEAVRNGITRDDKIPHYTGLEAELADVFIRIVDMAEEEGLDVAGAVLAKMKHNADRDRMHGGKAF